MSSSSYVGSIRRPPRTLTAAEQNKILRVTGRKRDDFRDHCIISVALGTALREHEIAALDVGDLWDPTTRRVRRRIVLRVFKRAPTRKPKRGQAAAPSARPQRQEVFLPDATHAKLTRYLGRRRREEGGRLTLVAALFRARGGARLSTRTIRHLWRQWQIAAGFDHTYKFHELRHTAATNFFKHTKDLRATQLFARHSHASTTELYTHMNDEEMLEHVRGLRA